MKAIVCKEWGGPDKLVVEEISPPLMAANQIRLAVNVAALSFVDILMPAGKYQVKPELPFVPGSHAAGEILEVGKDVNGLISGDRAYAYGQTGALAEEMVVAADSAHRLPENVSFETGAAYGNAYGTSFHALRDRAELQPGETLLVHGAGGGVGLAAVDLGREMGARVIATARGEEKAKVLRDYGAEAVIDYTKGPFKEQVKDLTNGRGADVIYDPVGGDVFDQSLRCISWGGRLLVVGFASGAIPSVPANLPLLKGCAVVGVSFGGFRKQQLEAVQALHQTLLEWLAGGRLKPMVSLRYPLERTSDAINAMTERRSIGRVIVNIR